MKPQLSNGQEESLEPTFLPEDTSPSPFPTFVTKVTLRRTLRHEIIGHFGLNTFTPGEKRALLTALVKAKDQPGISRLWSSTEKHYASQPESFRAEEVFCFAYETIEPHTPSNNYPWMTCWR